MYYLNWYMTNFELLEKILVHFLYVLTLQSSKSRSVYLLMFKVNQDILDDFILLVSQGVCFTEVQDGLIVRRGDQCLAFAYTTNFNFKNKLFAILDTTLKKINT